MSDDTNPTQPLTHEACGECFVTPAADFDLEYLVGMTINTTAGQTWLAWHEVEALASWLKSQVEVASYHRPLP